MATVTQTTTVTHTGVTHQERLVCIRQDPEDQGMEPDLEDTSHMNFVDGRCSCCPYGYHIDLDFLRYCESLNSGAYLKNLKKIRRNKRKLRKSMEIFLEQQQQRAVGGEHTSAPPPDVVNSTDNFMNFMEYEDSATNKILEEIDSSVNATLSSIDYLMLSGKKYKYESADSEYDTDASSPSPVMHKGFVPPPGGPRDPRNLQEMEQRYLSELAHQMEHPEQRFKTETELSLAQLPRHLAVKRTFITSAQLAGNFASLLPQDGQVPNTDAASPVDMANISQAQLQGIREHMAISLQRLRELEEQVKAIPVLQVRISVLKEEKRLLMLQQKAKNSKLYMRSIGVGDARVDDLDWNEYNIEMNNYINQQQTGSLLRPKPPLRTIGVGDGNVFENYQIQAVNGTSKDRHIKERELHTEQNTHTVEKEKEIQTLVIGQGSDRIDGSKLLGWGRRLTPEKPAKKIPTRSIGVGNESVLDGSSNVHVHEKELRTVIIGGKEQAKSYRNVGILCKAAMRDVGVTYMREDSPPTTRSIGIGVGEIGFDGLAHLAEYGEGAGGHTTIQHSHHMSLQQMYMAAFHTRNINIKQEDLIYIIDTLLKKTVHSVGVQVRFSTEDKAVSHVGYNMVSVGSGTDSVDVVVKPVCQMRSIGVDNRINMVNRSAATEKAFTRDEATNTKTDNKADKAVSTMPVVKYPAATNTELVRQYAATTETDTKVFQFLDQIKNIGCNTNRVYTKEKSTSTDSPEKMLKPYGFDVEPRFRDKGVNTQINKYTMNKSCNTDLPRLITKGVGDLSINQHVDCDICLVKPQTRNVAIGTGRVYMSSVTADMTHVAHEKSWREEEEQRFLRKRQHMLPEAEDYGSKKYVMHKEVTTTRDLDLFALEEEQPKSQSTVIESRTTSTMQSPSHLTTGDLLGNDRQVVIERRTTSSKSDHGLDLGGDYHGGSGSQRNVVIEKRITSSMGSGRPGVLHEDLMEHSYLGSGLGSATEEHTATSQGSSIVTGALEGWDLLGSDSGASHQVMVECATTSSQGMSSPNVTHVEVKGDDDISSASGASRRFVVEKHITSLTGSGSTSDDSAHGGLVQTEIHLSGGDGSGAGGGGYNQNVLRSVNESFRIGSGLDGGSHYSQEFITSTPVTSSHGRKVTVMETHTKRHGAGDCSRIVTTSRTHQTGDAQNVSLRSIMKQPGIPTRKTKSIKKEITFAEGVIGGYVSSSDENEGSGSESEGSQSSNSFDEGSYDGREGKIVYQCTDDEVIAQGQPGAAMFDQNIRETFEPSKEVMSSCHVYAQWLRDSTGVTTKQLNSSLNVIQQEWFKVSSHKLSNPCMVEDYLSSFKEISDDLLEHIVNMSDANGNTCLHYAVSHCNMEIVNLLLDTSMCDVNNQNRAGYTAVMLASLAQVQTERHRDIIQRLFSMGDVNEKASQAGQTALMLAVSHGRVDMVRMLLDCGAAINAQDDDGSTALMCASEHGHADIVKLLLAHPDCDPSVTDNDGSTALSIAMEAGHRDVGVLLYAHVNFKPGSSPETKRKLGSTGFFDM